MNNAEAMRRSRAGQRELWAVVEVHLDEIGIPPIKTNRVSDKLRRVIYALRQQKAPRTDNA